MKFIETNTQLKQDIYFDHQYRKEQLLFFDIETTGFSSTATKLYLIGCMYFKDNCWQVGQWFNDDGASEQRLLEAFIEFAKNYKFLIHFNGDGFDLPYINQKCGQYDTAADITHMQSIDIYKWIRPYKQLLSLPNLKLKTLETYLNIDRNDTYSGGELIAVYDEFLRTQEEALYQLLLLHNYEDIKNMLNTCEILYYRDLFENTPANVSKTVQKDTLKLSFHAHLPKRLCVHKHHIYFTADGENVEIYIPIQKTELKYFFVDYRDYFYLPLEDTAIHKSVAAYMDKNYRKKATKDTCYQKITGYFLPAFGCSIEKTFGPSYKERSEYIEISALEQPDMDLAAYTQAILKWLRK